MKLGNSLRALGCALIGVMIFVARPALAQERKPNVVFILVDNVGWGNFGVYGGTIPTPRIDKLAGEGIRFNNYNVEVQCTPSPSAIHTGPHPVRSGTYTVPLPGQGKAGLAPWEYTIAELLSDAGYATALFGKWHLGDTQGRLPTDQGYDEWWGIMNSWDESGYTAFMRYAVSLEACATSRTPAPGGFTRMLSVSPPPSATRIGMVRCGHMSRASACRGTGRASNRWRPASIPAMCAHATSRCITSSRTPPGTTPLSCGLPARPC
jgi:hypothetical protein